MAKAQGSTSGPTIASSSGIRPTSVRLLALTAAPLAQAAPPGERRRLGGKKGAEPHRAPPAVSPKPKGGFSRAGALRCGAGRRLWGLPHAFCLLPPPAVTQTLKIRAPPSFSQPQPRSPPRCTRGGGSPRCHRAPGASFCRGGKIRLWWDSNPQPLNDSRHAALEVQCAIHCATEPPVGVSARRP